MPNTQHLKPNTQHRLRRVAIDLVPIRVGEGGTGSGIWTYARELMHAMDCMAPEDLEVWVLVNDGQLPYLSDLKNLKLVPFGGGEKNILRRLWWMHIRLPLFCLKHRVEVLHKLATETPFFCSARRVTTIHDFYYEYLMEQQAPKRIRLYERLENLYFSLVTKTCFRKSRALIAVSNATREEAVQRYPNSEFRISVIHHGAPGVEGGERELPVATRFEVGSLKFEESSEKSASLTSTTSRREAGSSQEDQSSINSKPHAKRGWSQPTATTFRERQSTNSKPDAFRILCVAKFMPHKGQHLLIDAFERMMDRHPELGDEVILRLRGFHNDADYFRRIGSMIEGSRYSDRIHLEEFNPRESIDAIYADADLVVLLSDYEGFGLPVLEAQTMGVPVLCSELPVLREVGGSGAVYVNRMDLDQVAEAMHTFVSKPEWVEQQRAKALENIKRFSWDAAAEQTFAVYGGV